MAQGRPLVVRNGYLPPREIMTGIAPVDIKVPQTRDLGGSGKGIHFKTELLPPYINRTKRVETVLPWLYLKGVSTVYFSEALAALLGKNATGLSAGSISRLKQCWVKEHDGGGQEEIFRKRSTFIFRQMAFASILGGMMPEYAFWSLLV
jgi:putative transposase